MLGVEIFQYLFKGEILIQMGVLHQFGFMDNYYPDDTLENDIKNVVWLNPYEVKTIEGAVQNIWGDKVDRVSQSYNVIVSWGALTMEQLSSKSSLKKVLDKVQQDEQRFMRYKKTDIRKMLEGYGKE